MAMRKAKYGRKTIKKASIVQSDDTETDENGFSNKLKWLNHFTILIESFVVFDPSEKF